MDRKNAQKKEKWIVTKLRLKPMTFTIKATMIGYKLEPMKLGAFTVILDLMRQLFSTILITNLVYCSFTLSNCVIETLKHLFIFLVCRVKVNDYNILCTSHFFPTIWIFNCPQTYK